MTNGVRTIELLAGAALVALATAAAPASRAADAREATPSIAPGKLPRIATIDERYQSYNVEMAEVIGGNFWKPYDEAKNKSGEKPASAGPASSSAGGASSGSRGSGLQVGQDPGLFEARAPIDLGNARLRKLAAALAPAYVRVSGSWANSVYFHDSDAPAPDEPPKGFQGVLSRAQWKGVVDFSHAVGAGLVTSFAISAGVRDADGVWTPGQAQRLAAYTHAVGGSIAAAEFFNEPTMPEYGGAPAGYDAAAYARDFAVFRKFAAAAVPDMLIVGPGGVGEKILLPAVSGNAGMNLLATADLLAATPRPVFDVFSYHFYGAASRRCASMGAGTQTTADDALSEQWLSRAERSYDFYAALRDRFEPGRPIWITEMADAACGGNPWAATFLDSFRYLDQLARLARRDVKAVFHNTLASSEYGMLDQSTFEPRPNYWAALLWRRLMGRVVLDAGASRTELHLYAQCLPGHPGGVTLLAINASRARPASIELSTPSQRYTLAARKLDDGKVQLNGQTLELRADDELPRLQGAPTPAGRVEFAPASITFLAVAEAGNGSCR